MTEDNDTESFQSSREIWHPFAELICW